MGLGTQLEPVISGGSGQERRQWGTGWILTSTLFLRKTLTGCVQVNLWWLHNPFPLPGALNARDAVIVSGGRPESWALVSDTRGYASNRRQKPFSFYLESKYNSKT